MWHRTLPTRAIGIPLPTGLIFLQPSLMQPIRLEVYSPAARCYV